MRKLFVVVLLFGAFGLFAQFGIPAGTKEIGILASMGDFLNTDAPLAIGYSVDVYGGYFLMDNLEGLLGVEVLKPGYEDADTYFGFKGGAYYHLLFSEAMGVFGGAWFGYYTYGEDNNGMYVPIDAGIEFFVSKSIGVRVFNRFQLNLEEGAENSDHAVVAMFGIF